MNTMTLPLPTLNLVLAWAWILAGFGSGALLGLRFARDAWLGGYSSLRRRMYRLGHISFFGLGFINLMFWLTTRLLPELPSPLLATASLGFLVGALSMPACCLVLAHHPTARPSLLFATPVVSLLVAGGSTLWMLLNL
jgi:hypothetical protein